MNEGTEPCPAGSTSSGSDSTAGGTAPLAPAAHVAGSSSPLSASPSSSSDTSANAAADENRKVRYTSRVRRGFGVFVMQEMVERAKELRAWVEAQPRNERKYSSKQLEDMDIAVAYIVQEAEGVETDEGGVE